MVPWLCEFGTRSLYLMLLLHNSTIVPQGFNCQGKVASQGIATWGFAISLEKQILSLTNALLLLIGSYKQVCMYVNVTWGNGSGIMPNGVMSSYETTALKERPNMLIKV